MSSDKIVVLSIRSQRSPGEKTVRLHKSRAVLGSSTSSDVRLDDPEVSSVHAILEVSGIDGKPVIYDLASETGLLVNGKSTVQASLEPEDKIQIGPYLVGVRVQRLSEVPRPPAQLVRESFGQQLFVSEKEDMAPLLLEEESDVIDIFDHRPEMKRSLQVVMFYQDTILEVEHFVGRRRVVIGPGVREDFSIPPFLGQGRRGRFELVTIEGGRYFLHLHENMRGVLSQNGKVVPVKDVLKSMPLQAPAKGVAAAGASMSYPLDDKDFAKVALNDVSFFLNFTPAPPRLRMPRLFERDPLFFKIWASSILFTLVLLYALSTTKVEPTIEIEQLPERVATIIYDQRLLPVERPKAAVPEPVAKPREKKPEPPAKVIKVTPKPPDPAKPEPKHAMIDREKPVKQTARKTPAPKAPARLPETAKRETVPKKAGGQEGAGARAKGPEGNRGKPGAPKTEVAQDKALRPGVGPKTGGPAMNRGRSQTDDLGLVDVFKEQKGVLDKYLAGGRGASNAAAKLEGYSGFTTKGEGGLGAAGVDKGGGGKSEGLGGLVEKGPGGGKKGAGLGALGSGGNILGGKGKLAIESGGMPEPIVLGAIDTDAIAREIAKHRDRIKYCYEKEINVGQENLAGRVGIRFVIGASGSVASAGVSSTSLRNANTERCVVEVIRSIQFPPIRGGGIAEVTYPFVFKPAKQ